MSNIPLARELLLTFSDTLQSAQRTTLRNIVSAYMVRDPQMRRAPRTSSPVTPTMRREMFRLASTDMTIAAISAQLDVNPGRVSEVLNGKR